MTWLVAASHPSSLRRAERNCCVILAKASSIGLKPGAQVGGKSRLAPTASTARRSCPICAPSDIIVLASALVGAALTIVGVTTRVGTVTISELSHGVGVTQVDEFERQGTSWLWILGWVVPGPAGITVQWQRWTAMQVVLFDVSSKGDEQW
jgi:hypothetical protein